MNTKKHTINVISLDLGDISIATLTLTISVFSFLEYKQIPW